MNHQNITTLRRARLLRLTSLSLVTGALASLPVGCSTPNNDLPLDDKCAQMGADRYEFQQVGDVGSFESDVEGDFGALEGALVIDDDDLTDDYIVYTSMLAAFEDETSKHSGEISLYESMDPDKSPSEYTKEEAEAVAYVDALTLKIIEYCPRYVSDPRGGAPTIGSAVKPPTFVVCKDKWNESGDGVVGRVELATTANPDDQEMAVCSTVGGAPNVHALNFWGPLSVNESTIDDGDAVPRDGFTYSGITVPLLIAPYKQTLDYSEWDGISFWARLADADEAIPIQDTPGGQPPLAGAEPPEGARPQDGVGQVGIIIQTIDTAAMDDGEGASRLYACVYNDAGEPVDAFCLPQAEFDAFKGPLIDEDSDGNPVDPPYKWALSSEDGTPVDVPQPFCIDYSPVDAPVGEETEFRNQCWDGFRTMKEVTTNWKFYFLSFDEMRQAGWGQVAGKFRTDQIRSVNILTSAFQPVNVMVDEVSVYRKK